MGLKNRRSVYVTTYYVSNRKEEHTKPALNYLTIIKGYRLYTPLLLVFYESLAVSFLFSLLFYRCAYKQEIFIREVYEYVSTFTARVTSIEYELNEEDGSHYVLWGIALEFARFLVTLEGIP